jgi:predicted  nucleic acid-binding Zn-ribbon protein
MQPQLGCDSNYVADQRLEQLRKDKEAAEQRADESDAKVAKLTQEILGKDQEISSLTHKLGVSEKNLDDVEAKLKDAKHLLDENDGLKDTKQELTRKIQLLEEELERADDNLKRTMAECVGAVAREPSPPTDLSTHGMDLGSAKLI